MKNIFVLLTLAFFSFCSLAAQGSSKQITILYKSYPYHVTLNAAGEIDYIVAPALEVMNGRNFDVNQEMPLPIGPYKKRINEDVAYEVYNSPENTTVITDIDGVIMTQVERSEPKKFASEENAVTFKPVDQKKEDDIKFDTKVIRSTANKEEADYYLTFQGFSSRLTPQLTDMISDIAKAFIQNPVEEVLINSYVTSGDATNRKLAEARIKSCYDLLQTYGVPFTVLRTEIKQYRSDIDGNVSITFN